MTPTREEVEALAPTEAYELGMDDAADKILAWLAKAVGGEDYTPVDGTEEWDGDVRGSVYAILKAGNVYDDENGRVAKLDEAEAAQAVLVERAAAQADPWDGPVTKNKIVDAQSIAAQQIKARIRALAPTAGVETLAKLREQIALSQALVEGALRKVEAAEAERDRLAAANAQLEARVAGLRDSAAALVSVAIGYQSMPGYALHPMLAAQCEIARTALATHGKEPT